AQIGTLPFTLIYFGKLSIIALAANLVVIPLVGIIIATGIVSLLLNLILPSLAIYYAYANEFFTGFMFWLINKTGNFGFSFIRISNFNFYDAYIIFSFLFLWLFFRKKIINIYAGVIIICLIITNIFLFTSLTKIELLPENELSILMIDVGQGDSFIVKFPNGKIALVDAGIRTSTFDIGKYTIEPLLNHLNIDKIDLAFISHMDIDHYGGYNYLISKGIINELIKPTYDSTLSKDVKFENMLDDHPIIKSYYNQKIIEVGNVRVYVLNFTGNFEYQKLSSNNKSGIIKIVYGNSSILFTGDIENKGEKYYAKYYKDFLKSDILKVPHHGSKTSSTENFIDYIKPLYSLISVGNYNKYHHPSISVLNRLQRYNSKLFRTDKEGAILFQSDGIKFRKINWRD
ncbi:MAG: ComEC family DNA internalization-related competence protein, partial [Bacteroidetes bacterium]|nr:ComEC family DNA internalization-related competence protein [Bacteroidota bacterium]